MRSEHKRNVQQVKDGTPDVDVSRNTLQESRIQKETTDTVHSLPVNIAESTRLSYTVHHTGHHTEPLHHRTVHYTDTKLREY